MSGSSMNITGAASKSRVPFGSNVKKGDQNKSSPLSFHRCCAFKRSNPSQRYSKPAIPGTFFCSSDHLGWDKKAAADSENYTFIQALEVFQWWRLIQM